MWVGGSNKDIKIHTRAVTVDGINKEGDFCRIKLFHMQAFHKHGDETKAVMERQYWLQNGSFLCY